MKLIQFYMALLFAIPAITISTQNASGQIAKSKQSNKGSMSNQILQNKETVQQLFETALNQRRFDLVQHFIHTEYIGPTGDTGPAAFTSQVKDLLNANPDLQWNIHELIAEENKVWARWTTTTNQLSGKPIITAGIGTYVFEQGKIIRSFALVDRLSFFQQKSILPADLKTLQAKASPEKVIFIDRFVVPANALIEFKQRVQINRDLIRNIPGFIEDAACESKDGAGNTHFVTIAEWTSQEALQRAKDTVQAFYRQEGFDMQAMMKRLNITMDRQVYRPATNH